MSAREEGDVEELGRFLCIKMCFFYCFLKCEGYLCCEILFCFFVCVEKGNDWALFIVRCDTVVGRGVGV